MVEAFQNAYTLYIEHVGEVGPHRMPVDLSTSEAGHILQICMQIYARKFFFIYCNNI